MGLKQRLRARSAGGRDTFLRSLISNAAAGSDLDHAPEKELCAIASPFLACGHSGWGVRRAKPAAHGSVSAPWPCSSAGRAHCREVFVWLRALEGLDAGKGAVLGDLVQFPSVPLMVGKLLSIPTL